MEQTPRSPLSVRHAIDLLLPLGIAALLVIACLQLMAPFLALILWALVFAICFAPVRARLMAGGLSSSRAATVLGLGLSLLILLPLGIAAVSAAASVPKLAGAMHGEAAFTVPPPPPGVADWPVVGERLSTAWSAAATDMPAFLKQIGPKLREATVWLAQQAGSVLLTMLGAVAAVVIACLLLAGWERNTAQGVKILGRVTGDDRRGAHIADIIAATVRSVALGVVGVAFVQAALIGAGLFLFGVPGAGLIALIAMFLGILQVPVVIVTLPAIAWAFATLGTGQAALFTVWMIVGGLSDAVLKPLLIGRGLEVPMPVILLGVIGGVIVYGLVGLFVGAVILAVGYMLFREWLERPSTLATDPVQVAVPDDRAPA